MYAAVPSTMSVRDASSVTATAPTASVASPGSMTFAMPKSSTFTVPSGAIFTFAGFRSRCTMPFSCAASSAAAIWCATPSASLEGHRLAREPLGERLALDELEHERSHGAALGLAVLDAVDHAMFG